MLYTILQKNVNLYFKNISAFSFKFIRKKKKYLIMSYDKLYTLKIAKQYTNTLFYF